MSSIYYILSERFDYSRLICDDAGPGFARRHGWQTVPLTAAHTVATKPHVFDNRLTDGELSALAGHVAAFPRQPVFIKVVDPQLTAIAQPFYQEVLSLVWRPNVQLVGPYHTTGITALAGRIAGREIYHFLPYAYDRTREQPIERQSNRRRKRKLLLSGPLAPAVYPDRWRVYKAQRRRLWAIGMVKHLKHPGYPDIGMRPKHCITGENFLEFASGYAAMWVDPSAEGLELLKYCDCAYAGCAPFGVAAATLPAAASAEIWSVSPATEARSMRAGLSRGLEELAASAARYRAALRVERDPDCWNRRFVEWWKAAKARLAQHNLKIGCRTD